MSVIGFEVTSCVDLLGRRVDGRVEAHGGWAVWAGAVQAQDSERVHWTQTELSRRAGLSLRAMRVGNTEDNVWTTTGPRWSRTWESKG